MKKPDIKEIDFSIYDVKDNVKYEYQTGKGLSKEVVLEISEQKNEPSWMRDFRLKALEIYQKMPMPTWGVDLSQLDIDSIIAYIRPSAKMQRSWDEVPEEIRRTFERLGIPEAERKALAGVGAQYDSEVVYHNIKESLTQQGVIFEDMDTAVKKYPDIIKEYFMTKNVTPYDHKFAALHAAIWSGGTFVYVPEGVKVEVPLQAYFRMNAPGSGQFEHTLIIADKGSEVHFIEGCSAPQYSVSNLHAGCVELFVNEGARIIYSTIENWSKNTYNLNTKRAIVEKDGIIEWISGSFGSHKTMLYPASILKGEGAKAEYTGVTFAAKGQHLDTGSKMIHLAPHTSSKVLAKSISKDGGISSYRGLLKIGPNAEGAKASVQCEGLMLDDISRSDTMPVIEIENDNVDIGHEAKVGRISDEQIFYLMSRGLSEDDARAMIVRGFVEPIAKALPLEYAVEMNRLIKLELEGAIG
ncbi:MAG: FeS assembly protein SufB [Caldanaerobacter subterraneus]|jgi:Fe-S cluster assembly protein SufB|uniref:Fe-S cluster assembly protein SufB n=1 Tax=Thermoanaerobacter uzonensis DSM 18761 TaxID=1123369 RepID=A0A1M4ZTR6_9THEO|nr:Fe-S cluster assembly protein SufB [Thermoanaerobacter uzonensis]KUJ90932.1 MAG: FeS assembly protein SufB [Thermoanaerobacter thermocopriae]KUK34865.1 MAG: FeS assembly protein SufB [Caldanaerobacter subterraneus]MDI3501098.1 Fe-S cluster assembly protein SufB [Thermoanaerobacter sp.]MDI3530139.1 Fe-S cluster assembly protein SufB [Thermoanaerobacter sp.]SHF21398.1 Fe-S cluster assembly protein SufB [Thermoanaerobacter uzonensis DSM 18761]